jgi:uncharacterized protein (DUF2236 family)
VKVVSRDELEALLAEVRAGVTDSRAGVFGPGSATWEIASDVALFLGGGRAALLQLAHPMVAYAIDQHSDTRRDVLGRFQRTFDNVFAMVFGTLDDAFAAARRVHNIHTRIRGTIPDAVGGWAAGTPYQANDAKALRWVHATLVDTTLLVRGRLGGPLPAAVRDRYVVEQWRFAAMFGIPRDLWPRSAAEHDAYMREMLAGDRICVAPCAREMAKFLVGRGVEAEAGDRPRQPWVGRLGEALTHALLPPHLAAQFELRGSPRLVRRGLAAFGAIYRRLPRSTTALLAAAQAREKLTGEPVSRFAAWTDRLLATAAQRSTGSG